MRVRASGHRLCIDDRPTLHWAVGALFLVVGTAFVGLGVTDGTAGRFAQIAAVFMGTAGIATALYVWRRAPRSRLEIDAPADRIVIRRDGVGRHETVRHRLRNVAAVSVEEGTDTDGDPVYRVVLSLRDGTVEEILPVWQHDRTGCEQLVHDARRFLAAAGVAIRDRKPDFGDR